MRPLLAFLLALASSAQGGSSYLSEAERLIRGGKYAAACREICAAIRVGSEKEKAARMLEDLWMRADVHTLSAADLATVSETLKLSQTVQNGTLVALESPENLPRKGLKDPSGTGGYVRQALFYTKEAESFTLILACRGTKEAPSELWGAALEFAGRCRQVVTDELGIPIQTVQTLWISGSEAVAGHTIPGHSFLSGPAKAASQEEVTRLVLHECGHLLFPEITGFEAPEDSVSGYLGEIIFAATLPRLDSKGVTLAIPKAMSERLQTYATMPPPHAQPGKGPDGMRGFLSATAALYTKNRKRLGDFLKSIPDQTSVAVAWPKLRLLLETR